MRIDHLTYQRVTRIMAVYYYLAIIYKYYKDASLRENQSYGPKTASGGFSDDPPKSTKKKPIKSLISTRDQRNKFSNLHRTDLYYYRARYYDPNMGRFLQTDPLGYQDSMNLYQAFNMNGVNFIDPYGEGIFKLLDNVLTFIGDATLDITSGAANLGYRMLQSAYHEINTIANPNYAAYDWEFQKYDWRTASWESSYDTRHAAEKTLGNLGGDLKDAPEGVYNWVKSGYKMINEGEYSPEFFEGIPGMYLIYRGIKSIYKSFKPTKNPNPTVKYNSKTKRFHLSDNNRMIKFKDVPWPKKNAGFIKMRRGIAKVGQVIDRYGSPRGKYLAPEGTPYEMRGIAKGINEYHKYKVIKSFNWFEGKTRPAPGFGSPGMGWQYMLTKDLTVKILLEEGYLKEIK